MRSFARLLAKPSLMPVDAVAIAALVLAVAVRAAMTAIDASSRCVRRRYLVSNGRDESGRALWRPLNPESEEDEEAPSPTTVVDASCMRAPAPAQLRNSVHSAPLQNPEYRVVGTVAVMRAVKAYICLLNRNVILSGSDWYRKDKAAEVHLEVDPDGVVAAVATLARRVAGAAAESIACNGADAIEDVARAAVGVGHKLCARLETLHASGSLGFAYEINAAMGCHWATPETCDQEQARLEFQVACAGFALSCCAYNLSANFCDQEAAARPPSRSELESALLCSVARIFHIALCLNSECDAVEVALLRGAVGAVERAFEAVVVGAATGASRLPAKLDKPARGAAATLLRGIAAFSEVALELALPAGTTAPMRERVRRRVARCVCEKMLRELV